MSNAAAPRQPDASRRILVVGDGGWGTAVAMVLLDAGHDVTMWGVDPAYLDEMARTRVNSRYLPGVPLPENLRFEADLARGVAAADVVFLGVPTQFLRDVLQKHPRPADGRALAVVTLSKGIEHGSLLTPADIVRELWKPEKLAALAGPSHAEEVSRRLPASVVAASADAGFAREVQEICNTPHFRVYTSSDLAGVEICGALKNVLAIAAGICQGLELGDNAMAALLTRGLAEMRRLGVALGARPATFAGLAGVGDLITTCCSRHGRNRAVGMEIGRGRGLAEILAGKQTVAEGVETSKSALALARKLGVEMPITEQVCSVLFEGKPPCGGVAELMARDPAAEADV